VIETGEPELASDVREAAEIALRSDETATYARLAPQSYMIVPLIAGDQMLGAMTFLSTTPGYLFDESDLSLASDLARRLALAVENARLYEDAERARARVSFVAEASEVLASSLDLETTLQRLARLAVPRLADLCRVYLIDPDGTLRMLAVAHSDPRKAALSSEIQERFPVRPSDPNGASHVVLTGEPQLIPELSDEVIEAAAQNEEHLRMLRELDMRSALSVPLVGRDGPLGAFTLIAGSSRPRFGEDDLRIGADLARRAAVAVENARLHAAVAEAAARSQESLALVIDSVSDYAIFSLDPEGRVESWNPGAERINGFRAEEIIGEHFSRFYTREDIERGHPAHELEVAAAEGRYAEEAWRLRKDGSRYWANVLITALRSTDGELRGFAKVTRDMSARKRADEELRRSNEELERYAYVASHDLSEPLRAIAGFSGLLRRRFGDRLGTEGEGFVDAIADGVERMQALIDDLLTFSRLDRAARDLAPVATAEVVAESVRALGSAIAETGGRVEVSGSLPVVLGQPSLLGQLFQNLIGNALKFAGEDLPIVVVSAERVGEHWRFSVRDNGIGIDPGDRDRIFDIFERLHGRDEFGGTGMGLAICRKAVELHGGQIWVQSAPDGGTEFRFTLPARES
jgi:PAS domain S-box-containing protein